MVIGNNLKIILFIHGYIILKVARRKGGRRSWKVAPLGHVKAMIWILPLTVWSSKWHGGR